jgi:integrase
MMPERLYKELLALWEASSMDLNERVFSITNNVRKSFASACEVAGIKHGGIDGLALHSLRHTAATRLVQGGMPLQLAGRILGHSQVNTTYRYLSANTQTLAQAAAIFEAIQGTSTTDQTATAPDLVN